LIYTKEIAFGSIGAPLGENTDGACGGGTDAGAAQRQEVAWAGKTGGGISDFALEAHKGTKSNSVVYINPYKYCFIRRRFCMQFLASSSAIFALIIPVIILFYLLRQKREEELVSSTLLWQKVLADSISQTPWQKLRRNLLMFLQLLLAALLVLALMRPYLVRMQEPGRDLLVLLDTSASMGTVEEGKTRLDLAKAEILELVEGQKPGTRFSVIAVGQVPEVLVNQADNPADAASRLKKVEPGLYGANLEPALSLVTALLQKGNRTRVVFFSDGGAIVPEEPVSVPDFEYVKVGSRDDNLAVGTFALRDGPEGLLALTRIDNFGSRETEATVNFFSGGKLLDIQSAGVEPGGSAHLFWQVPGGTPFLEVRLETDDGLAEDNNAWLVPRQGRQAKVLLVTKGNIFLEQVLKLNPSLEVHKVGPGDYSGVQEEYSLYIFDGFWPDKTPRGQLLVINPPSSSGLLESGEEKDTGQLEAVQGHALLQYVSWADVHIAAGKGLISKGGWQPLLTSGGRPLITAGRVGQSRTAVFGFDLHNSDLPLRPAFPILIQNMLDWLVPSGAVRESQVNAGSSVELAVGPQTKEVFMTTPDGSRVQLAPPFPVKNITKTWDTGLYKIEQLTGDGKQEDYLAVNFFSPTESQVKPLDHLKVGSRDAAAPAKVRGNLELWPWLVLAVLLLLSLEWWVYLCGH